MDISPGNPFPFGPTNYGEKVNFALVSKPAKAVTLCLYDVNSCQLITQFKLDPEINKTGNVWHIQINNLITPILFGWIIDGVNSPGKRYHFDNKHVMLDPFAKSIYSKGKWGEDQPSDTLLGIVNSPSVYNWEGDKPLNIPREKLIIYEMHVRSFTEDISSGVKNRGTYKGLIEKIPYLQELGVNAVELMPVYYFDETKNHFVDPDNHTPLLNVWGYSPLNFFTPMPRFSADMNPMGPINEFKDMVKALHKAGIEVYLDVVYNHTGEGGFEEQPLSFRGIDNSVYYMMDALNNPIDFTGCGNTVACNQPETKELIIDSLRYWVKEFHIDGFRFDLASVLYRGRYGKPLQNPPVVDAISSDPILGDTKLIAEPWDATGMYQVGSFYPQDNRWSEWNGKYRDVVRAFFNGLGASKGEFATRISGSQDFYGHGRSPFCSINFITAHDGFTLRDLVSYSRKHNRLNGEDTRDGSNDNFSINFGEEGNTDDGDIEELRNRQMKNFITILMISQGVPMILMGDEYGHTKLGNNNTYCQDNRLNWFQWDQLDKEKLFFSFYKKMIAFRKDHPILQRRDFLTESDISWHGPKPMFQAWDLPDPLLAFTLYDHDTQCHLYAAINLRHGIAGVTLPDPPTDFEWNRIVDTAFSAPFDYIDESHVVPHPTKQYGMQPLSVVILKALPKKTVV